MNIEEEILYCVFLYNRILIVVPLYVLSRDGNGAGRVRVSWSHPHPHPQTQRVYNFWPIPIPTG